MNIGGRLVVGLLVLYGEAVTAQVAPPMGSSPTPGAGLNYDARVHDTPADLSMIDEVNAARRDRNGNQSADAVNMKGNRAIAAAGSDLSQGSPIYDKKGFLLGKMEKADTNSVTVVTEAGRVDVSADAFGKNRQGLLLDLTKAQFDQLVATAATNP